jgi:predicted NBD/HSP70 family sugar kinase
VSAPLYAGIDLGGTRIKAVLARSSHSDSRPILYEHSPLTSRIVPVLGSKIDNVYDVLAVLQQEDWSD